MLAVTGYRTTIVQELLTLVGDAEPRATGTALELPEYNADRYVFAAGVLHGEPIDTMASEQRDETWRVNFSDPVVAIERILDARPRARICVVGSESAYKGSYDQAYAASKAALHSYVETKRLGPHQQLVAVAPGIIEDSGMTQRRTDDVAAKAQDHPKRRLLRAAEVARLIHFLLYTDEGYITNVVIRMNGGRHTWA